jgi:sulfur relay protein TusB/DsrH
MNPVATSLHQISSQAAVERLLSCVQGLELHDVVLLLEDAVSAAPHLARELPREMLFGLQTDAEEAGVDLIEAVQWLDDRQWLALIDRHSRCVSW